MRAEANGGPAVWAYAWWVLVGAVLGLGMASILTIGIFVLPIGVALSIVGALIPKLRNRSAVAIVAGLALPVLYLAWLNRGGPGEVCNSTGDSCTDEWSPWPFVAVGLLLMATPVAAARLVRIAR